MNHQFIELLSRAEASPKSRAGGAKSRFGRQEIEAMYSARRRGLSWADINKALADSGEKPIYKRPASLAQVVHDAARRSGIEPYITVGNRATRKKAA